MHQKLHQQHLLHYSNYKKFKIAQLKKIVTAAAYFRIHKRISTEVCSFWDSYPSLSPLKQELLFAFLSSLFSRLMLLQSCSLLEETDNPYYQQNSVHQPLSHQNVDIFFFKKRKKNEKKIANISLDSRNENVDYYSERDENLTSSGLSLCTHFFLIHVHPFLSFPAWKTFNQFLLSCSSPFPPSPFHSLPFLPLVVL